MKSKKQLESDKLIKVRNLYERRLDVIEQNLAIRDQAMGKIQETQKIIDKAKQSKKDTETLKLIDSMLSDQKTTTDKKISLEATKNAILMRLKVDQGKETGDAPKLAPAPKQAPAPIAAAAIEPAPIALKKVKFDAKSAAGKTKTPKRK